MHTLSVLDDSLEEIDAQNGPNPKVFISYTWKDVQKKLADNLYDRLIKKGIDAWKDDEEMHPGVKLPKHIATAINNCDVFLCILSNEYYKSGWCPDEFDFAKSKGKKLFCIRWNDDEIPLEYEFQMGRSLYHKFNPQAVDPEGEVDKCMDQLMKFIQS